MDDMETQTQTSGQEQKKTIEENQISSKSGNVENASGEEGPIEKAERLIAEQKKVNEETRLLVERQEKIAANNMMTGRTQAGKETAQTPEEELKKQEALKFWEGSQVADSIKRHG